MSSEVEEINLFQEDTPFEITINVGDLKKKKGIDHAERLKRIDVHKIHTVALIANARVRNSWINDPLLHARLLSLTPLLLQNAFGVIHKSRIPDKNQRGRIFERAVEQLTDWWANTFFEVIPDGHIRNRTYDETLEDILDEEVETIRSSKSLMKHALMRIPARLVVSVQSVPWQASVGRPKPKYDRKPKLKPTEVVVQEDELGDVSSSSQWDLMNESGQRLDDGPVPKSEKAKGKQKAKPVVKLRKTKSKGNVLGAGPTGPSRLASPDPLTTPPVYWTEVFSRPDAKWIPVDPIRGLVNKRRIFDPTPSTGAVFTSSNSLMPPSYTSNAPVNRRIPHTKVENRMLYVIAFEEDGYARDVTRRYAKDFSAKVAKVQGGSSAPIAGGGKGRQAWWDKVVKSIERPYRLNRDDLEDQELEAAQMKEGMPTTLNGFKDHPIYVLERHLKQTETIHPPPPATPEIGKFRGEPVYPRSSVVSLKTSENWMRNTGRMVKEGEQPMKMIKLRAGTVNRMRELEVLKDELREAGQNTGDGEGSSTAGAEIMQGLYAFSQTEPYVPEPVVNGKVPKNSFGNIDLYVPSMLPEGGVHIPLKGVAKIARKLGFDFAEAVTGFEFKKRRAFPVIEGIVAAAENEAAILEAYWEAEREAEEKARLKKEDRVLKHWTRLIQGLRIRQRLQEQYSNKAKPEKETHSVKARGIAHNKDENELREETPHDDDDDDPSDSAGGFLAGADRVVQAFHLPKNTHVVLTPPPPVRHVPRHLPKERVEEELEETSTDAPEFVTYDLEEGMDVDSELESVPILTNGVNHMEERIPKTMQQMAEDAAAASKERAEIDADSDNVEEIITSLPPQLSVKGKTPAEIAFPSIAKTLKTNNSNLLKKSTLIRAKRSSAKSTPAKSTSPAAARNSKRKRTKKTNAELDSEGSSGVENEYAAEGSHKPSPSKRSRASTAATPVATPPSTRTLRPRASKTPAQIAEEKDREEAYRRAVAK
ncbi:hypothetical protein CPB84DRAFT_1788199 [Gymnopilus junonius]|uniref:Rad4-domain-containing protein n=1 Tax=Gymnopilus junonius TaxID=109634 RepID=A0A9P5NHM5_GYMJU|nr:hypothetical protein CPB84DRAFT_1788199 [Gymnopilus junonius]